MPKYTVIKPFILPYGNTAARGELVELTTRQAKYLLLSGKIAPEASQPRGKKPAAKQED